METAAAQAIATPSMAGTVMSGADMIVQILVEQEVETLFGYSGGAILPAYDAIFRYNETHRQNGKDPVNLVVPANEQGAGFMAAGYARASGKVGAFLVTSGPGATNCVTPVRDCMADSVPVVMISGQVPVSAVGTDAFQEAPIANIMGSCAKHVFLVVKPELLESTLRTAFELARTGRPGPVVVDIPKDIQNWIGVFRGEGTLPMRGYRRRLEIAAANTMTDDQCHRFFEILGRSERPLLYVGGGVISGDASATLREFVARFGVPVVTTLMGIGAVDTQDPLCLHMLGMHGTAYANYAVEDCDVVIAVGARFDDRVAGRPDLFAPNARVIMHIDIDGAEIGKVKSAQWHHVGDAKETLQRLLAYGETFHRSFERWHRHIAGLKRHHTMNYDRQSPLIQPYYVLEELNKLVEGNAIFATGVGQHQMWAAQYLHMAHPRTWLTSGSMGTMGFGLPAAIGAQLARPDMLVFDIDGDGSLRMNLGELETVTTYSLPVKVLLLNNLGDGMVRQWQKTFFKHRFAASDKSLHRKDFVKAAEADGFAFSKRISNKQDVPRILAEFVAFKGPAFLEVMIDPDAGVYPMVGPGQGYKQMICGDFITARETPAKREAEVDPFAGTDMF
jgi:acetolactate synthase-1/2/3 large subunit